VKLEVPESLAGAVGSIGRKRVSEKWVNMDQMMMEDLMKRDMSMKSMEVVGPAPDPVAFVQR
jgi:hypothetical protein